MNNKSEFRIKAKNIRKTLDIENISKNIIDKIATLEIYKSAKNIMIYCPLEQEIDLLELAKDKDKTFYLPRMNGENLECCTYFCGDNLSCAKFNVKEPLTEAVNPIILDLVFVPALMVDKNNFRLGYGKGFYDRFLEGLNKNTKTIVAIAKELVVENLPTEPHDKKVDIVITQ